MTIIPNNPADDKASSVSKKRNAELKSAFFRKAATVAIKKTRLRRAAHAINITSMFGIVILFIGYRLQGPAALPDGRSGCQAIPGIILSPGKIKKRGCSLS
jgi:hypothetical protein